MKGSGDGKGMHVEMCLLLSKAVARGPARIAEGMV